MMLSRNSGRTSQWICQLISSGIVGIAVANAPQMGWAQDAAFDFNGLAAKGAALARQDPMAERMRSLQPDDIARRGFDIGLAAAEGHTLPGPGKQRIHDSLRPGEQEGYSTAVTYSLARNQLAAEQAEAGRRMGPVAGGDNDTIAVEAVKAHNKVRTETIPAPVPALSPMEWSNSAATVAQGWADNCRFMHNPQRGSLGENLYATIVKSSMPAVVAEWASESAAYNYGEGSCGNGGNGEYCAHYTQIVWRSSLGLGCAMNNCATGSPFGVSSTWQLWVCNYSPPGNVNGERPY